MTKNLRVRLLTHPYDLFLLTTLLLLVYSFFLHDQTFDFHIHDTYFVVATKIFFWFLAFLFLLAWGLYKLTNRVLLTTYLTWLHVATTIIFLCFFMTMYFWHDKIFQPIDPSAISRRTLPQDFKREKTAYLLFIIIFIAGQIAYGINFIGGLIKRVL